MAVLTLVPVRREVYATCTVQFAVPSAGSVEALANVALLFPLVFFGALALRRPLPAFAAGALLSLGIETVQALLPALGRSCDTNDWAMNTAGAAIAALLAAIALAFAPRPSPPRVETSPRVRLGG